tara:strand:+ start:28743 stop:29078 length:336 start_codon:yes stop_codon:yes gene_type:complete
MIDVLREHCLAKKEVSESFPFDEKTLVFKVYDKMFALISLEREPLQMNLKCEPEKAIELREEYYQVIPGYHSNKKHWNTIVLENISIEFVKKWIDHSYELVLQKLPKKIKQ